MSRSWMILVVAIAACNSKGKVACEAEATELGGFLTDADDGPNMLQEMKGLNLVSRPELPRLPSAPAPVVVVMPTELLFQGSAVDAAALGERLDAANAKVRADLESGRVPRRDPPNPRALFLQIDAAARWSDVVAVTRVAAAAKFDQPIFAFARPQTHTPPPPSSVDADLRGIEAESSGTQATKLAALMTKTVERCPALQKVFGSVASDEGEDKGKAMIAAIPPALVDCRCKVDLPALRTTMWWILTNRHPSSAAAATLAADGEEIAFPGETPWSTASQRFTAATRAVRLVVR